MFMSLLLATCNDAICKSFNNIMAFICFVLCFRTDFNVGKKLQFPTYRDSLKERGTVQMLTVSREVALDVQVCCTAYANSFLRKQTSLFLLS
jgi:hypothetical protein